MNLEERRESYESAGLDVNDASADPFDQFGRWYHDAEDAELWEPDAMVVSVVDAAGWPTSRYVLMKHFDASGFVFYTNYQSAKGVALQAADRAAITFGWLPLRRQVRVLGSVARVSPEESSEYF
ncbi:MAG: pyridoxal 5'-phosphate synthase, partial [Acidimicrobiales bacterium]